MQEEEKGGGQDYANPQKPDLIARAKEKLLEWRSKKQNNENINQDPVAADFEDIKLEIESPKVKVGESPEEK